MKNKGIQTGVWLDSKQAYLMSFENDAMTQKRIKSDIDFSRMGGGARSKTPYGPMDKTSESKKLEKHLRQEKDYFENLLEAVKGSNEVYLFGPAQIKERFRDFLNDAYVFKGVIKKVDNAQKMTENQRIAQVRTFFKIGEEAY